MTVKSIFFVNSNSFLNSLLGFCLIDVSIGERGVLKSPITSVCGLMSSLSSSKISFT